MSEPSEQMSREQVLDLIAAKESKLLKLEANLLELESCNLLSIEGQESIKSLPGEIQELEAEIERQKQSLPIL